MIRVRVMALAAVAGLAAALTFAAPASATIRSWSPDQDLSAYDCATEVAPSIRATACLVYGRSGGQVTYRAALKVTNTNQVAAIRLEAAVINMWAGPSPSKQVADDGCLNSSLSPGRSAICWGTLKTNAQVCAVKPTARYVTAAGAVTVSGNRPTPTSTPTTVVC
jgi:hypothetical protein